MSSFLPSLFYVNTVSISLKSYNWPVSELITDQMLLISLLKDRYRAFISEGFMCWSGPAFPQPSHDLL